jgi:hypothetical protein
MKDRVEVLPSGSCRGCAKGYFGGGWLAVMPCIAYGLYG